MVLDLVTFRATRQIELHNPEKEFVLPAHYGLTEVQLEDLLPELANNPYGVD